MQRIRSASAVLVAFVVALLLAGCNSSALFTPPGTDSGSTPSVAPTNLSDAEAVSTLCGDDANAALEYVRTAAKADPNSGQRNVLTNWGVANPADDAQVKTAVATLKDRAKTPCTDVVAGSDRVGVQQLDGSIIRLPLVESNGGPLVVDSTGVEETPPLMPALLDGNLRFTAQTLSWAGLVDRVGDQKWYIDGVNARAAQTGFDWNDVLRFAKANRIVDNKIQGVNALAIQVYNQSGLSDKAARNLVRKYITPKEEAIIGLTVEELPIQRINNGFINTRNVGTGAYPKMGDYFDTETMVRVSLMPIKFKGKKAVSLDGSRGAGVFIDCGNLHWVPKAMWFCEGKSCEKPVCPSGMTGTPPNCKFPPCPEGMEGTPPNCYTPYNPPPPPPGCTRDCEPPPVCKYNCNPSDDKDWSKTPQNEGWVPLGPGPLTDGKESQRQKESGQTSGNVIDNKVPENTKSDDVTPDLPSGTVTAPDATPNEDPDTGQPVEDVTDDVVDEEVTNDDDGGTSGDTCVADPDTGESNCG